MICLYNKYPSLSGGEKSLRGKMMSKKKKACKTPSPNEVDLARGKIKDNFLAALVTSKVYKMQVVKAKKGKGSYQRKAKNARLEPYLIAA
jgi:alternative ribosome-rescue factor